MIEEILKKHIAAAIQVLYQTTISQETLVLEITKPDFTGDFTYVTFPIVKISKKNPELTATEIGNYLIANCKEVESFNVIKGFLNIVVSQLYWLNFLNTNYNNTGLGFSKPKSKDRVLIEYSSPNTNKPLHLGHIRNNLLGYSLAQILKAAGHEVITCNLVNDRGIHICKSMYAWVLAGKSETPENTGLKGDHLVGKYYVAFDKLYKAQIKELMAAGQSEAEAEKNAPAILAAQEMLRKWESGDEETIKIWKTLNGWVYNGFDVTYKKLGVSFDKFYYESNTYLLGKELVAEGLESGAFFKKDDGSVWIDLTEEGLDEKLLLRADGTSVYITQDIGTAELKYADFGANKSIYVVGNEQDYHFKVLKLICKKLNKSYADGIFHLSYGMVELPHGKMKSREGTVVDADDLIAEMEKTAAETTAAAGKTEDFTPDELLQLYTTIGLGALKYFILKVDPKKKILFNPEESIDFHGNTGPFIQYTYARAKSVLRNAQPFTLKSLDNLPLNNFEKELILKAYLFKQVVEDAGLHYNPSIICNYTFELAKCFNQFYHECSILKEQDVAIKNMRLMLCSITAIIIKNAFGLLGINVPERM
jgi:arginyl-tRNA synthetase